MASGYSKGLQPLTGTTSTGTYTYQPSYEWSNGKSKSIDPFEALRPFLESWTVGFDRQFTLLEDLRRNSKSVTYPPYNIKEVEEGVEYEIEMAVAGFSREDIDITVQDNSLRVEGGSPESKSENYVHKGIAARTFVQTFALADYVEVKEARLENGILTISLIRELPEEKRPKIIEIVQYDPVLGKT